jgi:hypothetical protein
MTKQIEEVDLNDIDELWVAASEPVISFMDYIDKHKHTAVSDELKESINKAYKKMMLLGKRLVDFCNKLGYTSKRAEYGEHFAIAYAMDIKVKAVQSRREDYQKSKKEYLTLAACLGNTEGWLCLVELIMLEHPKSITEQVFEQYLSVIKTLKSKEKITCVIS